MPRWSFFCVVLPVLLAVACSDTGDSISPQPPAPLLDRYVLSSDASVPEGVAFDPVGRAFFATSLQGGGIVRIAAEGEETIFLPAENRAQLLGAKIDADRRRLWVCAQGVDGLDNRVWVLDLGTAELVQEYLLGALDTDGNCNDLVLDEAGVAYVTDPSNPNIYRLDPDSGKGSVFATGPLLTGIPGTFVGLNGIAFTADGSALVVAKFIPTQLLRVSVPDPATIDVIDLGDARLPPPDGLVELGGDIYSVSDRTVSRTRISSDGASGEVVVTEQRSGLSTATLAEGGLYVIKSEVLNFVVGAPLDTPFEIFRVDLSAFDQ